MTDKDRPNTADQSQGALSYRELYLKQLQGELKDPLHKRIIAAYQEKGDPVAFMEAELGAVLIEILSHED